MTNKIKQTLTESDRAVIDSLQKEYDQNVR